MFEAKRLVGEDPAGLLHRGTPIRFPGRGRSAWIEIDLLGASREEIEVTLVCDEQLVRVRGPGDGCLCPLLCHDVARSVPCEKGSAGIGL